MLRNPATAARLGLSAAQNKAIADLEADSAKGIYNDLQSTSTKTLALLNDHQKEVARAEILNLYHSVREAVSQVRTRPDANRDITMAFAAGSIQSYEPGTPGEADAKPLPLPVYEDLESPQVRKELVITEAQERQLRRISASCLEKANQLRTTAGNQTEYDRGCDQINTTARSELETVLTAKQLASLNELIFRANAANSLSLPRIRTKVQLTDGQVAELTAIRDKARSAFFRQLRTTQASILGRLSEQQLKLLREQMKEQEL